MTHENITTPTPAATLTERDLWHEFTTFGFPVYCEHTGKPLVLQMPTDILVDSGMYGKLDAFEDRFASDIGGAESPSGELDALIEDLSFYIRNLKFLQDAFASLRARRIIERDDEPAEQAEYSQRGSDEHGPSEFWSNISDDEDSDGVEFEDSGPFPNVPPAFVEMTPKDEASIREEAA